MGERSGAVSREYHLATLAARDERIRELEAELAAIRPKAEAQS